MVYKTGVIFKLPSIPPEGVKGLREKRENIGGKMGRVDDENSLLRKTENVPPRDV